MEEEGSGHTSLPRDPKVGKVNEKQVVGRKLRSFLAHFDMHFFFFGGEILAHGHTLCFDTNFGVIETRKDPVEKKV